MVAITLAPLHRSARKHLNGGILHASTLSCYLTACDFAHELRREPSPTTATAPETLCGTSISKQISKRAPNFLSRRAVVVSTTS